MVKRRTEKTQEPPPDEGPKIYVVIMSGGWYGDYREHNIRAFRTEAAAKSHAALLQSQVPADDTDGTEHRVDALSFVDE